MGPSALPLPCLHPDPRQGFRLQAHPTPVPLMQTKTTPSTQHTPPTAWKATLLLLGSRPKTVVQPPPCTSLHVMAVPQQCSLFLSLLGSVPSALPFSGVHLFHLLPGWGGVSSLLRAPDSRHWLVSILSQVFQFLTQKPVTCSHSQLLGGAPDGHVVGEALPGTPHLLSTGRNGAIAVASSCFLAPASWGTHPEDQATVVFTPLQAP